MFTNETAATIATKFPMMLVSGVAVLLLILSALGRDLVQRDESLPAITAQSLEVAPANPSDRGAHAPHLEGCPIALNLAPAKIRAKFGERVTIQIDIVNRSDGAVEIYNPTLDWSFWSHRALVLAISSDQGTVLGDLLAKPGGPNVCLQKSVWRELAAGGTVPAKYSFRAGHLYSDCVGPPNELPPGTYSLELQGFGHLVCGRPDLSVLEEGFRQQLARLFTQDPLHPLFDKDPLSATVAYGGRESGRAERREPFNQWERTFPGPEICRSNRVLLEILPRTGD